MAMEVVDLRAIASYMQGLLFEDFKIGAQFKTASRTITESDLITFVGIAGLNEPLFLDSDGARAAGFSGRLVPAALTFAYAEGLVMQSGVIHDTGTAFLGAEVKVAAPLFVGDTITVVSQVIAARPTKAPGRGIVTTVNQVVKRDGSVVMTYTPVRMIKGRS